MRYSAATVQLPFGHSNPCPTRPPHRGNTTGCAAHYLSQRSAPSCLHDTHPLDWSTTFFRPSAAIQQAHSSQPAGFPRTAHARAVEATAARATTTQARRTPSATSRSSSHSQLRARRGGEGLQTVQSPARKSEANELHLWCLPSSPVPGPMLSSPPRRLVSILYSYMLMSILYPSACARQTCSKALGPVLEASRPRRVKKTRTL